MVTELELRELEEWAKAWKVLPPHSTSDIVKQRKHLGVLESDSSPLAQAQAIVLRALVIYPEHMTDMEVRYWSKVHIVDDDDSCWHFGGYLFPAATENYGNFNMGGPGKGKTVLAHRMSFALMNGGESPPCVRHKCDNPPCVRPGHLEAGTHAENMKDKFERGRGRTRYDQRGEANDSAVLTEEIVLEARRRYRDGESAGQLAQSLNVALGTLQGALSGTTWSHLNEIEPPTNGRRSGSFLNESDVRLIRKIYAEAPDEPKAQRAIRNELAERYMVSSANIYAIVKRKSWKHVTD